MFPREAEFKGHFGTFRSSISIGNRTGPSKIKDKYHACFQKLLKLPESPSDEGNFSNF